MRIQYTSFNSLLVWFITCKYLNKWSVASICLFPQVVTFKIFSWAPAWVFQSLEWVGIHPRSCLSHLGTWGYRVLPVPLWGSHHPLQDIKLQGEPLLAKFPACGPGLQKPLPAQTPGSNSVQISLFGSSETPVAFGPQMAAHKVVLWECPLPRALPTPNFLWLHITKCNVLLPYWEKSTGRG